MEKIQAFRASDGALFGDEEHCSQHELLVQWEPTIEAFCRSEAIPFSSSMHRTMAKKILFAWEVFKAMPPGSTSAGA